MILKGALIMEIKRIGIAGAGTMGYSMADIFASYGFDVTLWNHRKPTLERAKTLISETSRDKIHYTTNLEDIAHLDIVIENVTEDMAIKEGFYESFCKMADADMILATNTSGLSINALAQFVTHRERLFSLLKSLKMTKPAKTWLRPFGTLPAPLERNRSLSIRMSWVLLQTASSWLSCGKPCLW